MSQQILWALVAQTAVIVAGVVAVILYNNARFQAIEREIDQRFESMKLWLQSEFRRVNERIDQLHQRIDQLTERVRKVEDRLDKIDAKLERPLVTPLR